MTEDRKRGNRTLAKVHSEAIAFVRVRSCSLQSIPQKDAHQPHDDAQVQQ